LYRFVDSSDKRVYLYTHFEPFNANMLVPSFDQPNLRGRWLVDVRAPEDWVVVTSVREESIEKANGTATWYFPESPPISSYIFPLHAGQYHSWESTAGDIPLRLFARESLAEYVRAEWLLDITARGMAYYEAYFDEPYPFDKYDQLIVPDFNIGGMENVAAVTYTERYIPRGEPTRDRLRAIASTFLHELSHMWFGDLVTIDWWNALWLKESFASLMDPLALESATDLGQAWLKFYLDDKQLAYTADQRVTTHPIEMPVRDTKSGDASFDRITYQKGASVLKQLMHFLGEETFREGVRQYMNRYAWEAAVLADFMDTLAEVSGRDMHKWSREWVENAGLNTVTADFQCANGLITTFSLRQTAPDDYPLLRNHRLQAGLYQLIDGQVSLQQLQEVELEGAQTAVPGFIGEACPLLVYPNVGDWAYIKVQLDETSLQHVPGNLNNIADPLLRSMFWFSLWDAVRDVNLPLGAFMDIALDQLPAETNTAVLQALLSKLMAAKYYLHRFGDNAAGLRERYLPAIEMMARQQTLASEAGSDRQKQWFDAWLQLADTPAAMNEIEQWLRGRTEPTSLHEDQDRRWAAVIRLASLGYPGTDKLQADEISRDPSDSGAEALLTAQAAWPDISIKEKYLGRVYDATDSANSAALKAMILNMFPPGQESLHDQAAEGILEALLHLDVERDQDFIEDYVRDLLPALCNSDSVARLNGSIDDRGSLGLIATKALRVAHQEDQRCVAMAAKQLGGLAN
jgi:aminopeptidase N